MLRKDFLWGGAVTAHQSEGGYTEGGKVPAVCDLTVTGKFSDFKNGIDAYIIDTKKILTYIKS